jgi:hypothetical protein
MKPGLRLDCLHLYKNQKNPPFIEGKKSYRYRVGVLLKN